MEKYGRRKMLDWGQERETNPNEPQQGGGAGRLIRGASGRKRCSEGLMRPMQQQGKVWQFLFLGSR
jgi:hypothetical protein